MTLQEAIDKAKEISKRESCVQHVNRSYARQTDHVGYHVSDWYDCDSTVRSFEHGREL